MILQITSDYYLLIQLITVLLSSLTILYDLQDTSNNKEKLYQYKIKYFVLNRICVYIYIAFNIYLFFFIRSKILNKEINIFVISQNIFSVFENYNKIQIILINILLLLCCLISIVFFVKIHKFFVKHCIKRYLYLIFDESYQSISLYFMMAAKTIYGISSIASFWDIIASKITFHENDYFNLRKLMHYILLDGITHFLLIFILYEIIFNNFTFSMYFNQYLYFYLFYIQWKRFSNFICNQDLYINGMVYNMYYRSYSIKYVNLPDEWKTIIYDYVANGLYRKINPTSSFDQNGGLTRNLIIDEYHLYKTRNGKIYINENNDYFKEKNNKDKDLYEWWNLPKKAL